MKKYILLALAALLTAVSCGILGETREEKLERQAREAAIVHEQLTKPEFKIGIDRMIPLRGMGRSLTSPYWIIVKDGELDSNLPYFGEVWQVPYGGGHGLNFTAPIADYAIGRNNKGGYEVRIQVRTDEDVHLYSLTVFENGSTSLDVMSRNRDRISFTGNLDFYWKP